MSRRGEAWNEEDLQKLRRMAAAKKPLPQIARALERTPAATAARARRLKVTIVAPDDGPGDDPERPYGLEPLPPLPRPASRYRVTVFGRPRGPWRDSHDEAMKDAIAGGLASWDGERREHFLAVPVDVEVRRL